MNVPTSVSYHYGYADPYVALVVATDDLECSDAKPSAGEALATKNGFLHISLSH